MDRLISLKSAPVTKKSISLLNYIERSLHMPQDVKMELRLIFGWDPPKLEVPNTPPFWSETPGCLSRAGKRAAWEPSVQGVNWPEVWGPGGGFFERKDVRASPTAPFSSFTRRCWGFVTPRLERGASGRGWCLGCLTDQDLRHTRILRAAGSPR